MEEPGGAALVWRSRFFRSSLRLLGCIAQVVLCSALRDIAPVPIADARVAFQNSRGSMRGKAAPWLACEQLLPLPASGFSALVVTEMSVVSSRMPPDKFTQGRQLAAGVAAVCRPRSSAGQLETQETACCTPWLRSPQVVSDWLQEPISAGSDSRGAENAARRGEPLEGALRPCRELWLAPTARLEQELGWRAHT